MKRSKKTYVQADVFQTPVPAMGQPPTHTWIASGLYVITFDTGARSFYLRFQCRGVAYGTTIGNAEDMSLKEAVEKAKEAKKRVKAGGVTPEQFKQFFKPMTVRDFYERHYRPHCQNTKKSHRNIDNIFQKRILPTFGDVPLKDITRKAVREYIMNLHGAIDG